MLEINTNMVCCFGLDREESCDKLGWSDVKEVKRKIWLSCYDDDDRRHDDYDDADIGRIKRERVFLKV